MPGKERLMERFDAFIFDWDGTLSSSLRVFSQRIDPYWKYKMVRHGRLNLKRKVGKEEMEKVLVLRKGSGIEKRILLPLADISLLLIRPKLYDGAKATLRELKKKRKRIALFTNGASYRVLRELRYLGLEEYFEVIVSAQDLRALKPNPLGLLAAMKTLGTKKGKVLYIGDMIDDVMMAKYAKVKSCALSQGFDRRDDLEGARPDYIFESIEQFRKNL